MKWIKKLTNQQLAALTFATEREEYHKAEFRGYKKKFIKQASELATLLGEEYRNRNLNWSMFQNDL
jgi:hypothetical protein